MQSWLGSIQREEEEEEEEKTESFVHIWRTYQTPIILFFSSVHFPLLVMFILIVAIIVHAYTTVKLEE
jgi:hypothetical protein